MVIHVRGIEAALTSAIARWNAGDLDGYLALYDDRLRLHGYSPEPLDKAGTANRYRMVWPSMAAQGSPNPRLEVQDMFSSGNRLVCRFVMSGNQQGPYLEVPPTGRPYALPGMTIMDFDGDKVVERWSLTDRLAVLSQIGAFPPTPAKK